MQKITILNHDLKQPNSFVIHPRPHPIGKSQRPRARTHNLAAEATHANVKKRRAATSGMLPAAAIQYRYLLVMNGVCVQGRSVIGSSCYLLSDAMGKLNRLGSTAVSSLVGISMIVFFQILRRPIAFVST